jgi:arylsulfatase A-like enzyme
MALDHKVGVVLDLLERDGLAASTVVLFMGDHGRAMVRGKQWPYDSGLHVPLVIYWPGAIQPPEQYAAGGIDDDLVSAIDVAATTLAIAGIEKPEGMQGRVLLGSRAEPRRRLLFGSRDRGDETVDRVRTVRSARYRYIRNYMPERPFLQTNRYKEASYPMIWVLRSLHTEGRLSPAQAFLMAPSRPEEELYDLEADPHEIVNLAGSPDHANVLAQLRTELDGWIEDTNDLGREPEDPAVVEYYEQRMKTLYDERIEALREQWGLPARPIR